MEVFRADDFMNVLKTGDVVAFTDAIFGGAGSNITGNASPEIDLGSGDNHIRWSADGDMTVNGGIHDDTLQLH